MSSRNLGVNLGAQNPEFDLLLCCTQSRFDNKNLEEMQGLHVSNIDWAHFVVEARKHGVLSLLHRNLHSNSPFALPPALVAHVEQDFKVNAKRNLLLIREITGLIHLLETSEIPVLFFKRPLLGAPDGTFSLRASADLDIVVHEVDFPALKSLLLTQGYLPPPGLSRFPGESLVLCAPECHFIQPTTGVELNVHWQVPPRIIAHSCLADDVWERVQWLRLGATRVPTLSDEDLLLFLCIYGAANFWHRLGWICDVAGLIASSPSLDWAKVVDRAERQNTDRMLLLGLALAADLTHTELPAEMSARICADQAVTTLATRVRKWLASDTRGKLRIQRG